MIIRSWTQAESALRARGQLDLRLRAVETRLNAELDAVKARHAETIDTLTGEIAAHDAALHAWAEARRDEMKRVSEDGGLVYRCLWGKLAFRRLPPKIKFLKKVETVLAALQAAGLRRCVRTIEEPNKEVLLALDDDTLKRVHVKKVGGQKFEVVPDYEEIRKDA